MVFRANWSCCKNASLPSFQRVGIACATSQRGCCNLTVTVLKKVCPRAKNFSDLPNRACFHQSAQGRLCHMQIPGHCVTGLQQARKRELFLPEAISDLPGGQVDRRSDYDIIGFREVEENNAQCPDLMDAFSSSQGSVPGLASMCGLSVFNTNKNVLFQNFLHGKFHFCF